MTQTTGGFTLRNCKVEYSLNGSAWTDMSGFAGKVEIGGGDRETGEFFTADGDTPILGCGKRGSLELTVSVVHTEGASDPSEILRAAYEAGTDLYVRFSPKGGSSGQFMYTSSKGIVTTPAYPQGEFQSGDPIPIEFTLKVASLTKSVIA